MYRTKSTYGETHSQVPSTSITQDAHQNFPVKNKYEKPYTRVHRLILRSGDKVSGTIDDALFRVDLQNIVSNKCKLVVEEFYMVEGTSVEDINKGIYHIHVRNLSQPLSFSSANGGTTDIVANVKGTSFVSPASHDSLGIPLGDASILNGSINIYFTSASIVSLATKMENWVLVLSVVEE